MAQKKKNTRKGPLSEKPILVGFTHEQAQYLAEAAAVGDSGNNVTAIIRTGALMYAQRLLRKGA